MAKIVSEKREIKPIERVSSEESEPKPSPLVNLLGMVLVSLFVLGALVVVVLAVQ